MKPIITVHKLSKKYSIGAPKGGYRTLRDSVGRVVRQLGRRKPANTETIWALEDVSFDVYPGEVVGVIGRNGAGKSTLLKILSRITEPTTGTVDLFGRVASLLEVGTGFHPELTGRENIFLNGAMLGMRKPEIVRNFDEIVAFSEIEKFLDTPVKHYSSGMYVRLAFAVAAHLEPEILIVDEVLAVGDAPFQRKCLGRMSQVASTGRTVIFVSHSLSAVQQLCGTALYIKNGRIVRQGPTEFVVEDYLSDVYRPNSRDGYFDFSDYRSRTKDCHPIIQALTLFSEKGVPTFIFYPGDQFIAEIRLRPLAPIREPRIVLAIDDSVGHRITTVASYFQAETIADIRGECTVRCAIPQLSLGTGRYLLSVGIHNRDLDQVDSLQNVAAFEVAWNNSYGNGESYHPVYGPVLTSSSWSIVE